MTDVEKVARAMAGTDNIVWDDLPIIRTGFDENAGQNDYLRLAKAAIAAYQDHLKAEGLVVVPVEPTEAMEVSGKQSFGFPNSSHGYVWEAMVEAAENKQ